MKTEALRGVGGIAAAAALAGLALLSPQVHAAPMVNGPIPADAAHGHPFDASDHHKVPMSLADFRYVEEEFFVSGEAKLYRYEADFSAIGTAAQGAYVTRILIRRPADPKQFSGNVVVELYNAAARFDQGFVWADGHEQMIASGDIWIGVTSRPSAVAALKKFNAARYAPLSWASPDPTLSACATLQDDSSAATENGLVYDIVTQIGSLVRLKREPNPLAAYDVRAVFAAGYSQTASVLFTYIGAIAADRARAGKPAIFDGYLLSASGGGRYPLSQCGTAPPTGERRAALKGGPSAVIQLQTQSDFIWTLPYRRPDGNAADDRYRLYEIPGVSHVNASQTPFLPGEEELSAVGLPPVDRLVAGCDLKGAFNPLPSRLSVQSGLSWLQRWVRQGTPPPPSITIETDPTAQELRPALDRFGNAKGGLRNPYLDVPRLRYFAASEGAASRCRLYGYVVPIEHETLKEQYGSSAAYRKRVISRTNELEAQGWLLSSDARAIREDIRQASMDW